MKDVAVLTEKRYLNYSGNNQYVNNILKEDGLVLSELDSLGLSCARVAWDGDRGLSGFKHGLFRTTWNYFDQLSRFKAFLNSFKKINFFINPHEQIVWNLDKSYLLELNRAGVNIPKTHLAIRGDSVDLNQLCELFGCKGIVVKPCVSAAAWNTHYFKKIDEESQVVFNDLLRKQNMLVQEFQKNILSFGELSLMIIGGEYSHAVIKKAKTGDFRVQDDFGGTVKLYEASKQEVEFAKNIIKKLPFQPVYARVDLVLDNKQKLALSELELIEPEMWFRLYPGAAKMLAKSIRENFFKSL